MIFLRHIKLLNTRYLIQNSRNMASFYVKCVDSEESLEISFDYAHRGGVMRSFNACRPKVEPVQNSLTRIAANINKHINKKKRKKTDTDLVEVRLVVYQSDSVTKVPENTKVEDALQHGNKVVIDESPYTVDVNPPLCRSVVIPQSIMVGFPLYPQLDLSFADLNDSEYVWEKIKYKDSGDADKMPAKPDPSKIIERVKVCTELSYVPTNEDIGYRLAFTCIPRSGQRVGRPCNTESKFDVTSGPGLCPFEHRHLYTQKETNINEIRVVSYNILADLYADQEFSRNVLFSYCAPYALNIGYRKHLIVKELKGYNCDIMCLQEVDEKVFRHDLSTIFEVLGYHGVMMEKTGEVREGSAIFFRKSRFRLVEEYREGLQSLLETNAICSDIVKKVYAVPDLKQVLETRTTVLHVVALEPIDQPGRILLVANTHLYFHPDAGHIRMIQTLIAMRYIEHLYQVYKKNKPSLVFCGDFNSTPHRAIYEFMTTQSVKEDNIDWKDGGDDQFVPEMNFSHKLHLENGCGKPAYTNFTEGFNGHLDYIYYDTDNFEVSQVIPPPDHKDVEFHTAIPSIVFPSDHIAQICDLRWKQSSNL
ncbi:Endonuclease/Exonuclease/phosphatase [Mactra antiquata]